MRGISRQNEPRPSGSGLRAPLRSRLVATGLVYLAGLAGLLALLFRSFLVGNALYIGNSDRLNTYLNVLCFHVDGIRNGRLSAWNESLFGGMNTFGLAYTFPNPLTYLLSLAAPAYLFSAANLVSLALLVGAGWASFAFIRNVCGSARHAFIGAALYELCYLSVLKASQNDMSFAVFIVIPLMLLTIRSVRSGNQFRPFVALSALMVALLFLMFLQKAAYAVLLGGCYALYRGRALRSWLPVCIFAAALLIGAVAAAPRIYTVQQELVLTVRSTSAPWTWPPALDGLRFFSDALFGRSQLESREMGNGVSHSEGMLLYLSCFAPWLLAIGLARYEGRWFGLPRSGEAGFFFWAVVGGLAIVYVTPLYNLFHYLFLSGGFIHARLLMAVLLPLCTLVALLLHDLDIEPRGGRPLFIGSAAGLVAVTFIHLLAEAGEPLRKVYLDQTAVEVLTDGLRALAYLPAEATHPLKPRPFWCYAAGYEYLDAFALRQIFWSIVTFAVFAGLLWCWRREAARRSGLVACLAVLMIGQTFLTADYRVNGPHAACRNWKHNYLTDDLQRAGTEQFRVPSEATVAALARRLETDRYRSMVPMWGAGWGLPAAHLGPFWRLRLLEGYGSAVPTRLYAVPFSGNAFHGTRAFAHHWPNEHDWRLLGYFNVKYTVGANQAFVRNAIAVPHGGWREVAPSDLTVLENPCPVVPRVFFARRVRRVGTTRAAVLALFGGHHIRDHGNLDALLPGPEPWQDTEREPPDPREESVAEGDLPATEYAGDEPVRAVFDGDRIEVRMNPCDRPRFLVLNELYHPAWSARVDGCATAIYPTNVFMRGLVVPPGATRVELRFRPWVSRPAVWMVYVAALTLLTAGIIFFRRQDRASPMRGDVPLPAGLTSPT